MFCVEPTLPRYTEEDLPQRWLIETLRRACVSLLISAAVAGGHMGHIYRAYAQHCPQFQMSFVDTVSVELLLLFLLIIVSCDFKIMTHFFFFFYIKCSFLLERGGGGCLLRSHDFVPSVTSATLSHPKAIEHEINSSCIWINIMSHDSILYIENMILRAVFLLPHSSCIFTLHNFPRFLSGQSDLTATTKDSYHLVHLIIILLQACLIKSRANCANENLWLSPKLTLFKNSEFPPSWPLQHHICQSVQT